jgi:hypothetical protein
MKPTQNLKPRKSIEATCHALQLADLKRRAPFEKMLIKQGYAYADNHIFNDDTQDCCFDSPDGRQFTLHTTNTGIRLNIPLYGLIADNNPVTIQFYLNVFNRRATITRFFDSPTEGYIQADAVFHGKFDRKAFSSFLSHWQKDTQPIQMVKDSTLKQWNLKRMEKTGGIS